MKVERMDGGVSEESQSEYELEHNGFVEEAQVEVAPRGTRRFNPWNADIHYGLTVNPAERRYIYSFIFFYMGRPNILSHQSLLICSVLSVILLKQFILSRIKISLND